MYNLKLIKSIATSKNISLQSIADNVGITPTGLSKIIRTNSTSTKTLTKIANILDVPVQTFIAGSESTSPSDDILKRIRKIINYLVYQEVIKNDKDLAAMLGYTKSSLSQILSGSVPADKFIERLCNAVKNINSAWIKTGIRERLNSSSGSRTTNATNGIDNAAGGSFLSDSTELLAVLRTENKMLKELTDELRKQIQKLEAQNEKLINVITAKNKKVRTP